MSAAARPDPLRSSPAFRRLWLARTISHLGDGVAIIALVLMVQDDRGTGTAVGALLLASSLPRFLGPVAGVVVDRVDQRALMVVCDAGNALIFAIIAATAPSFPVLLVLVAASATFDTFFAPAGRSVIPSLVPEDDLLRANAWMGTSLNLQVAFGAILGGALVAVAGARGALLVDAASFALSALLLIGLPALRSAPAGAPREGFLAGGRQGLAFVWRTRLVRIYVLALFLGLAFAAVDSVALVFLVRRTLGGGPFAFGLVSAAYGLGMLGGSLHLSVRTTALRVTTILVLAWAASGLGAIGTGLAPTIAVAALAQGLGGVGNGLQNLAADTLVQAEVPRDLLGRVFGVAATASYGGATLAYAAGGPLLDLTSPRAVFLIAGVGVLAVTAGLWLAVRRLAPPATAGGGPAQPSASSA